MAPLESREEEPLVAAFPTDDGDGTFQSLDLATGAPSLAHGEGAAIPTTGPALSKARTSW
jgi:hypothetical protein